MSFRTYFFGEFSHELQLVLHRTPDNVLSCGHCGVPSKRRALVDHQQPLDSKFALCWWGLTFLDQGLHSYFPQHYSQWLEATGGYPIPVRYAGMGCVRTVAPWSLVEEYCETPVRGRLVDDFLDFYVPELLEKFPSMAGLSPRNFFREVQGDRDFRELEHACLNRLGASTRPTEWR